MKRRDYARAIEDYETILKLDKDDAAAHNNLQEAKRLLGRANPIKWLGRKLELIPKEFVPETSSEYIKRAMQRPQSDYEGRVADYTAAIDLNPKNHLAYSYRGGEYYHQGLFELSLEDDTQVINLVPDSAAYFNNRGEVYFAMGLYKKAFADFKTGYELDAQDQFVRAGMAITLHATGHTERAYKLWNSLIEENDIFKSSKLAGSRLRWHPILISEAEKLIDGLNTFQE